MGTYKFACRCGETFEDESMHALKVKLTEHDCPLDRIPVWKNILNFIKKLLTGF